MSVFWLPFSVVCEAAGWRWVVGICFGAFGLRFGTAHVNRSRLFYFGL